MDEIKKAMLGDKEAQNAVTDRGELLPCPICGGEVVISTRKIVYEFKDGDSIENAETYVFCPKCRTKTESALTKNKLIEFWNTRPQILTAEEMERLDGLE